jgi:hypothetical protein
MQCRTCGMTLPRGAAVCPTCGTAVPGMGNVPNSGSYEPTIQVTPVQYPNQQIPPTSYGGPPPPPAYGPPNPYAEQPPQAYPYQPSPQAYPYQTPPPYQPMPGQMPGQQPGQPPRKRRTGLIIGIVITVFVLLCVGGGILTVALLANNAPSKITQASATVRAVSTTFARAATDVAPIATTAPTVATTQGGSGQPISPTAASIITGVTTAKSADTASAAPIGPTNTFAINTTVYITFTLDTQKHDFTQNPGYVQMKLYAGTQFIGTKSLQINRPAPGGYFTGIYYIPTTGYAELYWCTQQSCSDEQLAQVATFTITN